METTGPLTKEGRTTILDSIKNILIESNLRLPNLGKIAWRIEISCYKAAATCSQSGNDAHVLLSAYSAIAYRVMDALRTSEYLRDAISRGEFIDSVGSMTAAELNPHVNEEIRRAVLMRNSANVEVRISHAYICPVCKGNETDGGVSSQRRAADEGSTLTITCQSVKNGVRCKARWQIG